MDSTTTVGVRGEIPQIVLPAGAKNRILGKISDFSSEGSPRTIIVDVVAKEINNSDEKVKESLAAFGRFLSRLWSQHEDMSKVIKTARQSKVFK